MLKSLKLRDIGPAPRFRIELSDRLNLFTGDNGLGKTFILDIAWWALTGEWAGPPAWPRPDNVAKSTDHFQPQIEFQLIGKNGRPKPPIISRFDFQRRNGDARGGHRRAGTGHLCPGRRRFFGLGSSSEIPDNRIQFFHANTLGWTTAVIVSLHSRYALERAVGQSVQLSAMDLFATGSPGRTNPSPPRSMC